MSNQLRELYRWHSFAVWLEANGHWYMAQVIREMFAEDFKHLTKGDL